VDIRTVRVEEQLLFEGCDHDDVGFDAVL
jgi:hypothetical protein